MGALLSGSASVLFVVWSKDEGAWWMERLSISCNYVPLNEKIEKQSNRRKWSFSGIINCFTPKRKRPEKRLQMEFITCKKHV